jgi:hypothetical protein
MLEDECCAALRSSSRSLIDLADRDKADRKNPKLGELAEFYFFAYFPDTGLFVEQGNASVALRAENAHLKSSPRCHARIITADSTVAWCCGRGFNARCIWRSFGGHPTGFGCRNAPTRWQIISQEAHSLVVLDAGVV